MQSKCSQNAVKMQSNAVKIQPKFSQFSKILKNAYKLIIFQVCFACIPAFFLNFGLFISFIFKSFGRWSLFKHKILHCARRPLHVRQKNAGCCRPAFFASTFSSRIFCGPAFMQEHRGLCLITMTA